MIFFKSPIDYTVIDPDMTDDELQKFLKEEGLSYDLVDNSTRWWAFAQYVAKRNGFDDVHSASFAYMVSVFFADMGVSAGTDAYIKEEQLELDIIDYINECSRSDGIEFARNVFDYILNMYMYHIEKYEYKTSVLSMRVTPTQFKRFEAVPGKSNPDKLDYLLNLQD